MKAEKLQLAPSTLGDVVMFFDSGPDVEPSSLEDQFQFFLAWYRGMISWGGAPTEPPPQYTRLGFDFAFAGTDVQTEPRKLEWPYGANEGKHSPGDRG
jgi:hypothetical protein